MSTKEACIKLSEIRTDAGTQSRCVICEDVVADYAERMLQGDKFPAVIVFHDGTDYFLADGFHRVLACVRNEFKDILAIAHKGTKLDAIKFSIGANKSNGLRRTNADKRKCVWMALENFGNLSNVAIAEMAGVSDPFVLQVRKTFEVAHPGQPLTVRGSEEKRVGRDGKARKIPEKKIEPPVGPEQPKTLDVQFKEAFGGNIPEAPEPTPPTPEILWPAATVKKELAILVEEIIKNNHDTEHLEAIRHEFEEAAKKIRLQIKHLKAA